jgi:hypothetical protein
MGITEIICPSPTHLKGIIPHAEPVEGYRVTRQRISSGTSMGGVSPLIILKLWIADGDHPMP